MTTTETEPTAPKTTDKHERLVDLPLDVLIPNPMNLRRRLGELRQLTRSIGEVGVVVPLVVTPTDTDDGRYLVVAGHRRLAAATAANLAAVPCVVRTMDLAAQTEAMLCENDGDARVALDPIEEAAGYLRLVELGATARGLAAKVGRTAKHVAARLALLELPPPAQQAVAEGKLALSDADALLRVKDDPDLVTELLDIPDWQLRDLAAVIDRRLADRDREAAAVVARETAESNGLTVLGPEALRDRATRRLTELGLDTKAHRKEPCHVVVIEAGWRNVETVAVCTNPRRHTDKGKEADRSTLQVTPATVAGRNPEDSQRRAERKRVARRRAEFTADVLSRRLPKTDATAFALRTLLDTAGQNAKARAGTLLDLEPAVTHWGGKDWTNPLNAAATDGPAGLLRVAFAMACGIAEEAISTYRGYSTSTGDYLEVLTALGYEPDPYERAELATAASSAGTENSDPAAADSDS